MTKVTKKHMSMKEKEEWDALYQYIRHNVLGYDENQSLSKNMVLRIKGLLSNKFMANNNIADTANYSYDIVLNTFKFCMPDIQKALNNNSFQDENHKFNYILRIVEGNLNNVYIRMKNIKKTKEEANNIDISNAAEYVNTFKAKNDTSKTSDKYNDLW